MRYRFRGLRRDTAQPVEGHVEAAMEHMAYDALGDEGIVAEALWPDPPPSEYADIDQAIEGALSAGSTQVNFDDLSQRYKGQRVWVVDRDKIKHGVLGAVDTAFSESRKRDEEQHDTQKRLQDAIEGLFNNQKNIASQKDRAQAEAEAKAKQEEQEAQARQPAIGQRVETQNGGQSLTNMEQQIERLSRAASQIEAAVARIGSLPRGGGEGGGRYAATQSRQVTEEQQAALKQIMADNLKLRGRDEEAQAHIEA